MQLLTIYLTIMAIRGNSDSQGACGNSVPLEWLMQWLFIHKETCWNLKSQYNPFIDPLHALSRWLMLKHAPRKIISVLKTLTVKHLSWWFPFSLPSLALSFTYSIWVLLTEASSLLHQRSSNFEAKSHWCVFYSPQSLFNGSGWKLFNQGQKHTHTSTWTQMLLKT